MPENHHSEKRQRTSRYKYPEYKPLYRSQRFTSKMLNEMDLDQLWEELKELCEFKD